jgi:hypothetical protein
MGRVLMAAFTSRLRLVFLRHVPDLEDGIDIELGSNEQIVGVTHEGGLVWVYVARTPLPVNVESGR